MHDPTIHPVRWHRFPFPSERLLWLLLLLSVLFVPAVLNPHWLKILERTLALLGILAFGDWFFTLGRPFTIERHLPDRVTLDHPVTVTLKFIPRRPYPLHVQLDDDLPGEFTTRDLPIKARLKANPKSFHYVFYPIRRGCFHLRALYLWIGGPLGLVYRPYRYPLPAATHVYPDFREAIRLYLKWKHPNRRTGIRRDTAVGIGTEFHMLRLYQAGDDWRTIDWHATARLRHPHVRVYHRELQKNIIVVLDSSRVMGTRWHGKSRLDYAVAAAANLIYLALSLGDRVRIMTYDHTVRWRTGWLRLGYPLESWLEPLVNLDVKTAEPNFETIGAEILFNSGSDAFIVWLTSLADPRARPEFIQLLKTLSRRSPVLMLNLQDPAYRFVLRRQPEKIQDAYAAAYVTRALASLEVLDDALRRHGITVIRPDDPSLVRELMETFVRLRGELR